jgi:hypothetical protein
MTHVRKLLNDEMRAHLAGAFSSGLCVGAFDWLIGSASDSGLSLSRLTQSVLLAVAAYTASTLLLHRYWTGLLGRLVPRWILIATFGTLILIGILMTPEAIAQWGSPQRVEANLSEFISVRVEDARSVFILYALLSSLIMVTFHYAKVLIKTLRTWHHGGVQSSSILGRDHAGRRGTDD